MGKDNVDTFGGKQLLTSCRHYQTSNLKPAIFFKSKQKQKSPFAKIGSKGFFLLSYYDLVAMILLILIVPFWIMVLKSPGHRSAEITEEITYIEDDLILINILKTKHENKLILDYVIEKDETIKGTIQQILEKSYGKVCFELKLNNEVFIKEKCNIFQKEDVLRSSVLVPYETPIKVELTLPGYRE